MRCKIVMSDSAVLFWGYTYYAFRYSEDDFFHIHTVHLDTTNVFSPIDAQVNCLKKKIYKIDIKTAPTCFGAVTPSSGNALFDLAKVTVVKIINYNTSVWLIRWCGYSHTSVGEKLWYSEDEFDNYDPLTQLMQYYEGRSEINASYFIMLAHDVRGGCWWYGGRGWTFPPIFR